MAVSRINEAGLNVNQYGNRNLIINGAMQVAQRGTSATGLGGGSQSYNTVDRFSVTPNATAGRFTMTQDSSAPSGFANSVKLECTTADTSIAASEILLLSTGLEGQNLQQFAKGTSDAKPFAVSFYVKGNASATYVAELYDHDNTRQVSKTFSVTTSWSRVELFFPADTTGAFDDDNALSLTLQIWLHAGSTYSGGTLNTTWGSVTQANRAAGISSFFDSTNRTFFMTGVQLEVGDTATDFEHRTFADELIKCQRYFERMDDGGNSSVIFGVGYNESTSQGRGMINFKTIKRVDPTISISAVSSFANVSTGSTAAASALTFDSQLPWGCRYICTSSNTTLVDGGASNLQRFQNDATIDIDAEL